VVTSDHIIGVSAKGVMGDETLLEIYTLLIELLYFNFSEGPVVDADFIDYAVKI
jgi:hypothetical protein